MAKTDQELAQEELGSMGIQWQYGGDRSKVSAITAPFLGERRQVIRPEQSMIVGYEPGGKAIVETIPAQYGETQYDSSYAPVRRRISSLNDVLFGDANKQNAAIGEVVTALRGLPEYVKSQYQAGMAGGVSFDPETNTLNEFDPMNVPIAMSPAGLAGVASTGAGELTLGAMGSKMRRQGMTREEGIADAKQLMREYTAVPIEDFKPLEGAPKYSGPLDMAGVDSPNSRFAMVSAENQPNKSPTDLENIDASNELGDYLINEYGPDNVSLVKGDYGGPERTFMVEGMDPIAAANIGNRYGQDSVFTDRGILYTSGSGRTGEREQINPLTGEYGQQIYKPNIDPELDSFYTEIQPERGDPIRFSFPIDFNTKLEYPSGDLAPASARGVHFSRQEGLTETNPEYYGTGSAGAEEAFVGRGRRAYGEGPLRTYFYTPSGSDIDVRPEQVVTGANEYQSTLNNLYDIKSDPEGLVPFSKGRTDLERMTQSRGYSGILTDQLSDSASGRSGSAAVFQRQPVTSIDAPEAPSTARYSADTVASNPDAARNPIAMQMSNKIANDFEGAIDQYSNIERTRGGKVINADYARELSDDYRVDKTLASDVQVPSSEFARALYQKRLADSQGDEGVWVFTGGGTASGKSAGLSRAAENAADLVYDGTLKDFAKSDKMISEAADSGKKVKIVYVDRDPVKALPLYFDRANKEGRTVPIDVFLQSHRGARDSIRQLSQKYDDDSRVDIQIWSNQGNKGDQKIIDVNDLSDFNIDDVKPELLRMLDEYFEQGKISEQIYNATKSSI